MNTPICDFVRRYADSGAVRLHMPGHKGTGDIERLDITEICGADSLYEAQGIIAESEENASHLFGCSTVYSTEGSSQCIKTMLFLAVKYARSQGKAPLVLAGRNAHKAFVSAAALIDFEIEWLYGKGSYLSCELDITELERMIIEKDPCAVYLTSPDYLGNVTDIKSVGELCRKHDVLLLVDNAHGAYMRFLPYDAHPMEQGAHMCCDSAHKTLSVLTGGAYLHFADEAMARGAKDAMALFGSTSPSYLILQSLDAANAYLVEGYAEKLRCFCSRLEGVKAELTRAGYLLCGDEPMKICLSTKPYGYEGYKIAELLRLKSIECEFADRDYIVFMLTPENRDSDLRMLTEALLGIPKCEPIFEIAPKIKAPERVMSVREAAFSVSEIVTAKESVGRVLAEANVGCPPAVPIVVCGELIGESAMKCFEYYGIEYCNVVK